MADIIVPNEQKSKISSDLHYAIVISFANHGTAKTAPNAIVMSRLILDLVRLCILYVFVSSTPLYLLRLLSSTSFIFSLLKFTNWCCAC